MRFFLLVFTLIFLGSCKPKINIENIKNELMEVDEAFSDLSAEKGMKAAFLEYIHPDGILLRAGYMPMVGDDAAEYLKDQVDSTYTLTWKPMAADVSAGGDLGFTYGTYSLSIANDLFSGTYVSIWKKDPNGDWKFILDTGNQGTQNKVD